MDIGSENSVRVYRKFMEILRCRYDAALRIDGGAFDSPAILRCLLQDDFEIFYPMLFYIRENFSDKLGAKIATALLEKTSNCTIFEQEGSDEVVALLGFM
jgi:hypothetical protein